MYFIVYCILYFILFLNDVSYSMLYLYFIRIWIDVSDSVLTPEILFF